MSQALETRRPAFLTVSNLALAISVLPCIQEHFFDSNEPLPSMSK